MKACLFRTLVVCSFVLCAIAQDPTGTLQGIVTDPSGARVPHANVTAESVDTGRTTAQQTTEEGAFRFGSLPVGSYRIRVGAPGFAGFETAAIRLDVGRVQEMPLQLDLASASSHQITVNDDAATVDVSPTLGGSGANSAKARDWPFERILGRVRRPA
jgi:Carboxypeptidase regulatory-like domain